ncbi:hypothetical protein ACFLQ8_00725 [Candidatus Auribacterota bacterium]
MKKAAFIVFAFVLLSFTCGVFAEPQIPTGKMDIEGTIEEAKWIDKKVIKGEYDYDEETGEAIQMSGSAGMDRTIPAHYTVKLTDTVVANSPSSADGYYYIPYKSGDILMLSIDYDKDDRTLKKGMRIKIYEYNEEGDEGGESSSYEKIEIIDDKKEDKEKMPESSFLNMEMQVIAADL